jgi:shikimate dehydrogenase
VGAGGAVHGILKPLLAAGPASVTIANRTPGKAESLVRAARALSAGIELEACGLAEVGSGFDLVINGTSAGLSGLGGLLPSEAAVGAFCYDMFYGRETPFCRWARASGAADAADGLGMLVEQGALSFELWRGVRPDTRPVLAALRQRVESAEISAGDHGEEG